MTKDFCPACLKIRACQVTTEEQGPLRRIIHGKKGMNTGRDLPEGLGQPDVMGRTGEPTAEAQNPLPSQKNARIAGLEAALHVYTRDNARLEEERNELKSERDAVMQANRGLMQDHSDTVKELTKVEQSRNLLHDHMQQISNIVGGGGAGYSQVVDCVRLMAKERATVHALARENAELKKVRDALSEKLKDYEQRAGVFNLDPQLKARVEGLEKERDSWREVLGKERHEKDARISRLNAEVEARMMDLAEARKSREYLEKKLINIGRILQGDAP
jgi:chromosome segregation ATPase